jgi:hypothetical protein
MDAMNGKYQNFTIIALKEKGTYCG